MRFDIGDEVYILYKAIDQKAGWEDSMDKTVGWIGEITDIDDNGYGYKIRFEDIDREYFYGEDVVGDENDYINERENPRFVLAKTKDVWAIAPISRKIYKYVEKNANGWSVYVDKEGGVVTSEFFTLNSAPKGCKGFDYEEPKAR